MSTPSIALSAAIEDRRSYVHGVGLILLAGLFWSTAGVSVRLIGEATPWQILFWRSLFLLPVMLVLIRLGSRAPLWASLRAIGWQGLLGGLFIAFASTAYILSLHHTTVANTMFLIATAPFMTAVLALLLLREPVAPATWWTMALAVLGILIIIDGQLKLDSLFGIALGLICALSFSAYNVVIRAKRAVDMQPALLLGGLFTTLLAGAAMLLRGDGFALSGDGLLLCLFMAVVQMGLGGYVYICGARHVPAAECSLLALIEVLLGPTWVWLAVGEVPGESTLIGGGVVLLAVSVRALLVVRRKPVPHTV